MDMRKLVTKQWDRLAALSLTVVGAIMLISGWVGVSGTNILSNQAAYMMSGGLGGIFVLGVGATLWISADLRDEWRKLDRIEKALADGVLRWDDRPASLPNQEFVVEKAIRTPAMNGSRSLAQVVGDVQ
ncbi:MAG TPA: hypothetical protein VHV82_14020 [Sporichthyaceae bacterium]|jgi:hypothetical protein|nr:hypothetical protein [Sporichthyaceae bacterium]